VKWVVDEHKRDRKYLETQFGPLPATVKPEIQIESTTDRTAALDVGTNIAHLDVAVLHGLISAAVADIYLDPATGKHAYANRGATRAPRFPDRLAIGDPSIVQTFLDFKAALRRADYQDLLIGSYIMAKLANRFDGLALFTVAHETGHLALGHQAEACSTPDAVEICDRLRRREFDADRYAFLLQRLMVERFGWDVTTLLNFPSGGDLRGYPFFEDGYRFVGFDGLGECSCRYPTPEQRLANFKTIAQRFSLDQTSGLVERLVGNGSRSR
jgi:hypothetical protein